MVAIMNEALELEIGQKVLEVGSGSGWHATTIANIVAPSKEPRTEWGHVYTTEIIEGLAKYARKNIGKLGYSDKVTVIFSDGSLGFKEKAPYDRIIVTAAAQYIPSPLIEELKPRGIMVIPVGSTNLFQKLVKLTKEQDGTIQKQELGTVAFVPLTGKHGQKK